MDAQPDTKVLIFGSQTLFPREESFTELRATLLFSSAFQWIVDAVHELQGPPASAVTDVFCHLDLAHGAKLLDSWIKTGHLPSPLPNTVVTPLVVIGHLVQFIQYKELSRLSNLEGVESLGFCTGLLSAFAISSSRDEAEIQKHGAAAIRLAAFVGAIVDADNFAEGTEEEAVSLSAAWKSTDGESTLKSILSSYPEAYISVNYDKRRATITTSSKTVATLIEQLNEARVTVTEIGLSGRFHSQVHEDEVDECIKFVESHASFQLPDASELHLSTRSNNNGECIKHGKLHEIALRSMLVDTSNWYESVSAAVYSSFSPSDNSKVVVFGADKCVPSSLASKLGSHLIHVADYDDRILRLSGNKPNVPDNRIAVVGMACNVPGATNIQDYWDLLCEGKSQHVEVPSERIKFNSIWRETDKNKKWYGNFIKDYDCFDHKFFKKSPREMASTDPQQRQVLQVVYQAVEQSGYFSSLSRHPKGEDLNIAFYLGVGLDDYEKNIACHPANAYSATGNLRSFGAGKVSHYFGWTGPSLTLDTACSSSAVAVHHACRTILSGESVAAVAGGVNIMTGPDWYHNLGGAGFLSPTGQCKPFDVKGDGYCRGEAVGAVFLKRYTNAIADGNQVLGIIAATSVTQNRNCTAITVPDSPSLADMFRSVTRQAGLEPKEVSVVEAHGTGTPVGDPAEYGGVRAVFGGAQRSNTLALGSVKGLVGHTESASGLTSLIKSLLMIHHGYIPPQASHDTINPSLKMTPEDKIQIHTKLTPWDVKFRAMLINNYGASGSNASMIVTQAPINKTNIPLQAPIYKLATRYPFYISGFDDRSLVEYCDRLLEFIQKRKDIVLANLAFQLSLQSNRTLPRAFIFDAGSVDELEQILIGFLKRQQYTPVTPPAPGPVILCFGGQISTFVGLDKDVYESVGILRKHLDQVDAASSALRQNGSIYPGIFQKEAVEDIIDLQTQLFAIQYSVAKAWMEAGVNVAAVIGHSFGELTSLVVSGILSLEDGLRLIIGRARIIQESWGADNGAMMAVEGDLQVVNNLLSAANGDNADSPATIACYNGPTSFTLGGSVEAIDRVEATLANDAAFLGMKNKRLNVTNAFHSTLVEPLVDQLTQLGEALNFKNPIMPFERSTENGHVGKLGASYVAEHMRQPVFFNHALRRLSQKHPNAIYLEASSNSTITIMASRALGKPEGCHFQALSINAGNGLRPLTDATINLWREGINFTFWPHHRIQTAEYTPILLPPYQFEKSQHWMELKDAPKPETAPTPVDRPILSEMWEFVKFEGNEQRSALFRINTDSKEFVEYVSGHKVAGSVALCPSILQISIITAALISILPGFNDSKLQPHLKHMISHAPMTINPNKSAWLKAEAVDVHRLVWDFSVVSQDTDKPSGSFLLHFSLRLTLRSVEDEDFKSEFAQFERLITVKRPRSLLNGNVDVDEVIQGRNVYRAFADIVDYNDKYRGVQKIAGRDSESAGRVLWPHNPKHFFNIGLADSFLQVAGIYVNCMTDRSEKEMFISDRIEQWIRSPRLVPSAARPSQWDVYACHHQPSQKEYLCDVFAFDANTGELAEVIMGLRFQRVSKAGLVKMLGGSHPSPAAAPSKAAAAVSHSTNGVNGHSTLSKPPVAVASLQMKKVVKKSPSVDVVKITTEILMNLSGLEAEDVKDDSELAELGIDSLMGMELCREIEAHFKISYDSSELNGIDDFKGLIQSISKAIGTDSTEENDEEVPELVTNGHTATHVLNGTNGNSIYESNGKHTNGFNGPDAETASSSTIGDAGDAAEAILDVFSKVNAKTDDYLLRGGVAGYVENVLDDSNELVIVHILDAFEQLGCPIRHAEAGTKLTRIEHLPRHGKQVDKLYRFLKEAGLVEVDGDTIIRTAKAAPIESARSLLERLVQKNLNHESDHRLTSHIGFNLADCLIDVWEIPIQTAWMDEMKDIIKQVSERLFNETSGPIKILELGAGTGGTTSNLIEDLSKIGIPFEYTATDLSSSLVAGLRKRFKGYPFMKFKVIDVEKEPPADLVGSQHLILSTNCVHATRNLKISTKNIHTMLNPSGALLLLELTKPLYWFDLIFGMVEGWWLFEDGRDHALAKPEYWQKVMTSVGYGHVDWTDGNRPENEIQRLILATASSALRYDGPSRPLLSQKYWTDLPARETAIDSYVEQFTADFSLEPSHQVSQLRAATLDGSYVVLTGATGSLGGQLAAYFARLEEVKGVFCLNRASRVDPIQRQKQSMEDRDMSIEQRALAKLNVFETDTSKPLLGLSPTNYETLVGNATHIVHNAWPMSLTRDIHTFKSQFRVMQNLIHLARDIAAVRQGNKKASLLLVSSIATIGYNPLHTQRPLVPEQPMTVESVLPTGYGDAKLVCERIIHRTLGRHPGRFRAMTARIGQIAGSAESGYWNPSEHFSFMVKSSLTLQALPKLSGELSWCPANDVAASIGELVLAENTPYPIYHVENPSRQPWSEMIGIMADALGIPPANIIPFDEWVALVKAYPGSADLENPAAKLIDFLDLHFHRMSCGGLVMDTAHAREHSETMAKVPPVSAALFHKYVEAWKDMGFLS
uniref:Carrier domain-containing protein n=1 Tax=Bionectria ochroleuca TaxID=29856 RepID=A0A8H7NLY2_BIOOC